MNEEDVKALEKESQNHRTDKCNDLTLELLKDMLAKDCPFFELHYVKARTLDILKKTIQKLNYRSAEIEKRRREFLDVLVDGMNKELENWESEARELKSKLKTKDREQKRKIIDGLKRVERLQEKTPKDLTEERDLLCEPICQEIAKKLIDKKLLLSDDNWLSKTIEYDNQFILDVNISAYLEELFSQTMDSIDRSYKEATEKKWGKHYTKITMKELDNELKE